MEVGLEDVVKDRAHEFGTVEWVCRQRHLEVNQSVDGWVRSSWSWLSLNILNGSRTVRGYQRLQVELNECLLHWKDTL